MLRDQLLRLHSSWKDELTQELDKPYFGTIEAEVTASITAGKTVFPQTSHVFNAFMMTPLDEVRVVILGQDPYHGVGQAMGLCFSVPKGVKIPRSLGRIYKELASDVSFDIPTHGDLSKWAEQGVFMPNAILTVEEGAPASHAKIGWQHFTDEVIRIISARRTGVVFLLWGGFAKSKRGLIDEDKHHILESVHPSPLAGKAWHGNQHFSTVNKILKGRGDRVIDWQV